MSLAVSGMACLVPAWMAAQRCGFDLGSAGRDLCVSRTSRRRASVLLGTERILDGSRRMNVYVPDMSVFVAQRRSGSIDVVQLNDATTAGAPL
jgi:hypothetical protein